MVVSVQGEEGKESEGTVAVVGARDWLTAAAERLETERALPQQFPSKQYGGRPASGGYRGTYRVTIGNAGSVVHWATWLRTAPRTGHHWKTDSHRHVWAGT